MYLLYTVALRSAIQKSGEQVYRGKDTHIYRGMSQDIHDDIEYIYSWVLSA